MSLKITIALFLVSIVGVMSGAKKEGLHVPGFPLPPSRKTQQGGCYEISEFHTRRPPSVSCSNARNCGNDKQTICETRKVRANETKCQRVNRRGICVKYVTKKGWVNACVRKCKPFDVADGNGDPHLTTFDGLSFDFQGVPGEHYVVFTKSGGDHLVTRMRGSPFSHHGTKATYFDAFGLSTGRHKILVETVLRKNAEGKWDMRVQLNGNIIDGEKVSSLDKNGEAAKLRTKMGEDGSRILTVTTADAEYDVVAKKMWEVTRHLDVTVRLKHTPSSQFSYGGLLGHSLNRVVGHGGMDDELSMLGKTTERDDASSQNLEQAMRSKFHTSTLFTYRNVESAEIKSVNHMDPSTDHDYTGFSFTNMP